MRYSLNAALISIIAIGLVVAGCDFDPREPTMDDPEFQFAPVSGDDVTLSVQLDSTDQETQTEIVTVQLAGPSQQDSQDAVFEVNSENTNAVAESQYAMVTPEGTLTFGPEEHHEEIEVEIRPEGFELGEEATIGLSLTEASDLPIMSNFQDFYIDVEMTELERTASIEGDIEGSVNVDGNYTDEMFDASINLSGLSPESSYDWAIYRGSCEVPGDLLGAEGDYPQLVTSADETSATGEASVNVRLLEDDEFFVRIYHGSSVVGCQNIVG